SFAVILLLTVTLFRIINNDAVIRNLFKVASYTYGPLLGLYAFGFFMKVKVRDPLVPVVCLLSPIICWIINDYSPVWFNGYKFGFELLILNGAITFFGLLLLSKRKVVA
ncbi:MAG: sodium:solute symporter, partial [Bacteroidetes bacterium]|nr:sodium:solute symporter [Bacteroidota bacterium]